MRAFLDVFAADIEQAPYSHPWIVEPVVHGVAGDQRGEHLRALYALKPGAHSTEKSR